MGSGPGEKIYLPPHYPKKANQQKPFTLNRKDWLSESDFGVVWKG